MKSYLIVFKGANTEGFVVAGIVRKLLPEPAWVILGTKPTSHVVSKVNILSIM